MISTAELFRGEHMSALYVSLAMALAFCFGATAEASPSCAREDAIKAETEASTLTTWSAVFESYRRFRHCDDGAISEGYSNSVATLLASHWGQFESLRTLVKAHPPFEGFVLRHVDETMTSDQGTAIKENIRSKCPIGGQKLCKSIMKRFALLGFQ
jgi:hypothetical protein